MNKELELYSIITKINFICGSIWWPTCGGFWEKRWTCKTLVKHYRGYSVIITCLSRTVKCSRGYKRQRTLTWCPKWSEWWEHSWWTLEVGLSLNNQPGQYLGFTHLIFLSYLCQKMQACAFFYLAVNVRFSATPCSHSDCTFRHSKMGKNPSGTEFACDPCTQWLLRDMDAGMMRLASSWRLRPYLSPPQRPAGIHCVLKWWDWREESKPPLSDTP